MNKNNKGITLIALIITIIVLLILAGVTIGMLTGESSIIEQAKKSSSAYDKQRVKEKLGIKILDLQTNIRVEEKRTATLHDLKALEQTDKEIEKVELNDATNPTIAKVQIEGYIFDVESNLNILEGKKDIINIESFIPQIIKISTTSIQVEAQTTSNQGNIVNYAYYLNGEQKANHTETSYTFTNLQPNTEYEIYVIATDEKGNTKKSTVLKQTTLKVLQFTKELLESGNKYGNVTITTGNLNNSAGLTIIGTSSTPSTSSTEAQKYAGLLKWYKTFDLTDYSKLTFYARKVKDHGSITIWIDQKRVYTIHYGDLSTQWRLFEIDISNYTGMNEIAIAGGYFDFTGNSDSQTQYCSIQLE